MTITLNNFSLLNIGVDAEDFADFPGIPPLNIMENLRLETQGYRIAIDSPSIEIRCQANFQYIINPETEESCTVTIKMVYTAAFDIESKNDVDLHAIGDDPEKLKVLLNLTANAVRSKVDLFVFGLGIHSRHSLGKYNIDF